MIAGSERLTFVVVLLCACVTFLTAQVSEQQRIQNWHDKGNVWPPNWQPESQAKKAILNSREKEILTLTGINERWENFMQLTQSRMLPSLSRKGFVVVQTPSRVQSRLRAKLDDALRNVDQLVDLPSYPGYYTTVPAKHIDIGHTLDDLYPDLLGLHVSFTGGMDLALTGIHGMRLDRAGAANAMHYEHVSSRVVSALIHIGSELEEAWPLEIEDHNGALHAINLQPGQMLIYESAACLHGRRSVLKGKYYASVSLYYAPTDKAVWNYTIDDVVANVPPHWGNGVGTQPGSRHAGQALTIDSLISAAAPPRDDNTPARAAKTQAEIDMEFIISGVAPPSTSAGTFKSAHPWPWPYETNAWKENMRKREAELLMLTGADERWENFMLYSQGRLVPRFTEKGFKIMPVPTHIQQRLKAHVDAGLAANDAKLREEELTLGSYRSEATNVIDMWPVLNEVHQELLPAHEEWVGGMKLQPTAIYGVRVNRNGAALAMHYDKIFTHVISSIIHIDHEYYNESQPWPIEIEDHNGELHSFFLEPGQMLFYESSACLHGRRQVFKGKYYASAFAHYQPVDRGIWNYTIQDVIAHVPKHWNQGIIEDKGSRYAGQALTIDSRVADNAPPRIIRGQRVDDIKKFWAQERNEEL